MADRTDWLAERKTGIGGSDAAGVFNAGYGCRRRLFYDKRNIQPDFPFDETLIMALGTLMEPFFADQYSSKTGRFLSRSESRYRVGCPEARVNPDRLIFRQEAEYLRYESTGDLTDFGVLEIKAQGFATFSKTRREGLSDHYVIQEQHGMYVTGATWGSFQIGNRDSGESMHWDVERDYTIQKELATEIPKIWALIQSDAAMPDRLPVDDFRCAGCQWRRTCQGDSLVHVSGKSDLVTAEDIRPLLAEYDIRKPLFDEAEALLEETKEALKTALVERPAVRVGGGDKDRKIYYRAQDGRISWQAADLAKAYDKLLAHVQGSEGVSGFPLSETFMRQGMPHRSLRIY